MTEAVLFIGGVILGSGATIIFLNCIDVIDLDKGSDKWT